jgi:ribose/xylose/arabinose/galactoside ABC-type transport system permease subunit
VTVFTVSLFSILYPSSFATFSNFTAIVRNLAFEGILAIGMMVMLIGGSFDLSVGAMASMIGVITGALMKELNWPVPLAVLTGLLTAGLGGLLNGFIVAKVRVNALITTLGTMGIFQGIALLIGGPGITYLPEAFSRFGQSQFLGIQAPVWVLVTLAIMAHYAIAGMDLTAFHVARMDLPEVRAMAELFPIDQIFDNPVYPTVLANAFINVGIPAFTPEIGTRAFWTSV